MAAVTTGGLEALKQQNRVSAVPTTDLSIDTSDRHAEQKECQRVEDLLFEARERFRDAPNAADMQRHIGRARSDRHSGTTGVQR